MSKVIEFLSDFNRKERFILLNSVLGQQPEEVFRLNHYFAGRLANMLDLEIPADAFVAMDYHLDWIQMALYLANQPSQMEAIISNRERAFEANQEDVDLLIAFDRIQNGSDHITHLVLIEAKGDTGWKNEQLESKACRLRRIFNGDSCGVVKPHFVLMSPRESSNIDTTKWPCWMKAKGKNTAYWLELPLRDRLLKVTRCDEKGQAYEKGGNLFISKYDGKRRKWMEQHEKT